MNADDRRTRLRQILLALGAPDAEVARLADSLTPRAPDAALAAAAEVLAGAAAPDARAGLSVETLRHAASLAPGDLDDARMEIAARAVQRNLEHLQVVRALDLDDGVEPPTLFQPLR